MPKKKKSLDSTNLDLREIILKSKVPIITLDERWHILFPEEKKTNRIKFLEKRLNDLVKGRGKLTSDISDLKNLKKRLMEEVINSMGETKGISARLKEKKQDKIQKLILEINEKLGEADEALVKRPREIEEANADLLLECMRGWYEKMEANNEEIDRIAAWVEVVREELKEKLLVKQDREVENEAIYSYMHALLGPKVMENLDSSRREE